MSDDRLCIIVGLSVRSLAVSAAKAGIGVYAIDCFADLDVDANSIRSKIADWDEIGIDSESLLKAIEKCDPQTQLPVIFGGGLEHTPSVLDQISQHRRLLGNSAETIRKVCEPKIFFAALTKLGVPHPATQFSTPVDDKTWLIKTIGGSGGTHIERYSNQKTTSGNYFQCCLQGKTITATVLASEHDNQIVGFSEQWCSEVDEDRPFTYGGAVSIDCQQISKSLLISIKQHINDVISYFRLRGLLSFDMIIDGDSWYLLEVNPRPGFTFELHEGDDSFIGAHWDVFDAKHSELRSISLDGIFRAHYIVYASDNIRVPIDWEWPHWVTDQNRAEVSISKFEPLCTVNAENSTSESAKQMVLERHRAMTDITNDWIE